MPQEASPDLHLLASEGLRHHRAGRLHQAARNYREVLNLDPDDPDALHLLGALALQIGDADLAVRLIGKAIAENSDIPTFHSNFANALMQQGKPDHAIAAYRRALAGKPDFADAYYNLGNSQHQLGSLDDATLSYGRALAIDPTMAEAHCNLGQAMRLQGRADSAALRYGLALSLRPDYAEAIYNFGNALKDAGKLLQAETAYHHALACRQDFAEAHSNLGNVLLATGRAEDAVTSYRRALSIRPQFAEEHYNLGHALMALHCYAAAADSLKSALALRPDFAEAFNNLGLALNSQRDRGDASAFLRAMTLVPGYAEAQGNLGVALQTRGETILAGAYYRRALELRPDFADAHFNLGTALLLCGDLEQGWQEYEWRWKKDHFPAPRHQLAQPIWQGEPLNGKTILLHAEQGIGDAIQFIRYLPLVAARNGRILLEIHRPLMRLAESMDGFFQIIPRGEEQLPEFDLHCPLMSLPRVFGTQLESIPAETPYLSVMPEDIAHWRQVLPPDRVKVGIVWQGNPRYAHDQVRSVAPEMLTPLLRVIKDLDIHLVSLQKEPAQRLDFAEMSDFMDTIEDFYDTAALIANLDLVIAVDTAVAHLAGALGKPVWLLNRFDSDWRWLLNRQDSPWYPTLRIFRQTSLGDWSGVIDEVAEALDAQYG